jgi:hypothetical protein
MLRTASLLHRHRLELIPMIHTSTLTVPLQLSMTRPNVTRLVRELLSIYVAQAINLVHL